MKKYLLCCCSGSSVNIVLKPIPLQPPLILVKPERIDANVTILHQALRFRFGVTQFIFSTQRIFIRSKELGENPQMDKNAMNTIVYRKREKSSDKNDAFFSPHPLPKD